MNKKQRIPWNKGIPHSEETKRKISLTKTGRSINYPKHRCKISDEAKKRLSKIAKEKNFGKWMIGKKLSEEHKRNIGNAHKGMKRSEKTKKRMSEAAKGRKRKSLSKEHKMKLSKRMKGKKGPESIGWKNGKFKMLGYVYIYFPKHPFSTKSGYVLEHRLIIENQIGRYLLPGEEAHHVNKIRNDNRIGNLMAFSSKAIHVSFEAGNEINKTDIIFDGRKS